ncbi:striatin Pro11 [Verticillium alfalfae VaMs.102]|uniref:Striatin Pro11 n=1 Tax=Verticillium alfalfae (strain VaMs.102 / ATCC MYA-4576 / FGSC 10136) TaxID=526221 RepID=C9SKX3_VERA1|nr:striatin Pro11 [Verticillium alfalfae VaMs.102]EEY19341.1 striatin Pro11 [Verticillium alfalfae VaMs.102]
MSWQNAAGMGMNPGNGMGGGPGGGEMGAAMQGNGNGQPNATEYTLQGVMRFLQTEWHRHERDRNSWEIERQEMKGRIANLEGQARRADATQKALKRYVGILEKKVVNQQALLKGTGSVSDIDEEPAKREKDRAIRIQEKLHALHKDIDTDDEEDKGEDEPQRADLKAFLDQCQAEFAYLMVTPANPLPPRDSPPLPILEDMAGPEPYQLSGQPPAEPSFQQQMRQSQLQTQNHGREIARAPSAPNHAPPMQRSQPTTFQVKQTELPAQQAGNSEAENPPAMYAAGTEWPQPVSVTTRLMDDNLQRPNHSVEALGTSEHAEEVATKQVLPETDGWEFPDGAFTDSNATQPQQAQQLASTRPDTDVFPSAENVPKSPTRGPGSHRRKGSMSRRRSSDQELSLNALSLKQESTNFKLRFGLRGHLDTVRTVIFSGGGSPGEPEICTAGDDGMIKRFHIPRTESPVGGSDLDVAANFTHRGHSGAVLCLTSWSPSPNFSTGGRAQGDGWIFSGGQDASIRVWERGRVDPKATLDGHTDAVWAICVLPATLGAIFGQSNPYGTPDRILVASGGADGTVRLWAVSAPPQLTSPQPGANRAAPTGSRGRVRGNSMSSGSAFPNSPQPTMASNSPFNHTLIHNISRSDGSTASPTCITPLSPTGETFVVAYSDASIIVYDTRSGEQTGAMDSLETYDGTIGTSVNSVVATTVGLEQGQHASSMSEEDASTSGGPTGGGRTMASSGVEGVVISGHEDRFVRFFDANSGQCTYNMLAHPASISALSLSPDGRELVSAGHDASLRFWSLEKRSCTQEITSHRIMRGEGVCSVVWSQDGKWVVSGGGDGVVKVFTR